MTLRVLKEGIFSVLGQPGRKSPRVNMEAHLLRSTPLCSWPLGGLCCPTPQESRGVLPWPDAREESEGSPASRVAPEPQAADTSPPSPAQVQGSRAGAGPDQPQLCVWLESLTSLSPQCPHSQWGAHSGICDDHLALISRLGGQASS